MEEIKISVIVPIYNTEIYLRECLNSVTSQKYNNWEMFLIDDGSQDKSYEICKEFKKKYPNKIFVKKLNHKGVSVARNFALKKATGKYVVFLDSDDYLKSNLFEYINNHSKENIDVFVGEFDSISEDPLNIKALECEKIRKNYIDGKSQEFVLNYIYDLRLIFTLWRFVVKTSLIKNNNIYMLPNIIHEDEEWVAKMLLNAQSFKKYLLDTMFTEKEKILL